MVQIDMSCHNMHLNEGVIQTGSGMCTVTDPGFPRGSDNPKEEGGCQPIIQQNFPENCTKLNTIWEIWACIQHFKM